ncbi:TetR/AcrR family transcriptional regulator [Streptomyces orinoci]|uniref:TetR/AcrR family transcriptional regulator n=1 Tax=Streptomyces orinoci TaxID=67339 RepID=A0ABV3JVI6_STRON|nr:TetR/AcrR family transcriptional regulator [Streptomyces orinoci]
MTGTEVVPPAVQRGRPRSGAVDCAVIDAVVRLLEEGVGIGDLSMERIAREAGVGKATVYRRWPGKEALMLDVLRSLDIAYDPPPAGSTVRDALVHLLELMRRRVLAKRSSAVLRTVIAQVKAHPAVWREYHDTILEARRQVFESVLRRGIAEGLIRPGADLELLTDLLVSPLLSRSVLHEWKELPEGLCEEIVDTVLFGAGAAGPPATG